jgi:ATP-dependent Lon protease
LFYRRGFSSPSIKKSLEKLKGVWKMENLREQLQKKVDSEMKKYSEWLLTRKPKEIRNELYKAGAMEELSNLVLSRIDDEEVIAELIKKENLLEGLYWKWLNTDTTGIDDDLNYFASEIEEEIYCKAS